MKFKNSWNKEYTTIIDKETKEKKQILTKPGIKTDYRKIRKVERLMRITSLVKAELDPVSGRTLYGVTKK